MKNTLSVTVLSDNRIRTDITTLDGVSVMEIHRSGLSDAKVLTAMADRKYFQHFKGEWLLTFPAEQVVLSDAKFEKVIDLAQIHIFTRDNTTDYSGFC
jgi:hypothetical protein